jgi:hypothetical protein
VQFKIKKQSSEKSVTGKQREETKVTGGIAVLWGAAGR